MKNTMRQLIHTGFALLSIFCLSFCQGPTSTLLLPPAVTQNEQKSPSQNPIPMPPLPGSGEVTYTELKTKIIDSKCINCHSVFTHTDVDLSSVESIKNSPIENLVVSKDPENSVLYKIILAGEMPPPRRAPKLSDEELRLFRQWILDGLLP